jgi:hypothetical protein
MSMTAAQGSGQPLRISYEQWQALSADFAERATHSLEQFGSEVKPSLQHTPVPVRWIRATLRARYTVFMAEFLLSRVIVESS